MRLTLRRRLVLVLTCGLGLATAVFTDDHAEAQGRPTGPKPVGVVEMAEEDVPYVVTVPGRAVAYEEVDIRPRVGGVVSEIHYSPGTPVSEGDLLFTIEDETYAARVEADEAAVESAESTLAAARSKVERYTTLEGVGVTGADLEAARVEVAQAEASLSTARATLRLSRLDLEHTEIRSPIEGVPAVPNVSVGAVVTANQTDALTTVTRIDPIYVDVVESSARIARVRDRIDAGSLSRGDTLDVRLTLENGEEYEEVGELVSPGVNVSTSTGTATMRVRFDNPERRILPGQFLRVNATVGTTRAILVPQGATRRESAGTLTAFVVRDGKAAQVNPVEAGSYRNSWIVTAGIAPGDRLIVDGLNNLAPGMEVEPVPVTISEDGIALDASQADRAGGPQGETE